MFDFLFVDSLILFLHGIFLTVAWVHWHEKELDEEIHILLTFDNQVNFATDGAKCNALPGIERQIRPSFFRLESSVVSNELVIKAANMLSIYPETGGYSTINEFFNVN